MKTLFLFIATILTQTAKPQSTVYHPFPDSGIVWLQRDWYTDFSSAQPCTINNEYTLFISGDTTIGTKTYHKLYANGYLSSSCPPPGSYYFGQYWGAFRQNNLSKKLYLLINGIDSLAYDFNLNTGDTLPNSCLLGSGTNFIQSIDSILIGSQYHKRFWLSSLIQTAPNYATWIEGIGTSFGAFAPMYPAFESGNDLYCCKINNQTVWTNPMWPGFQCSPMAVNEKSKIENKISILPDPMHLSSQLVVTDKFIKSEFKVYNLNALCVKKYLIKELHTTISREGLPDGIYFYQILNDKGQTKGGKFIIE